MFYPDSDIKICHVDFDDTYNHVIWFDTMQEQEAYFESVSFVSLGRGDYTYVRPEGSIKVPYNAETMYDKNYVCFRNTNYGTRWFYAFITEVRYVNENTTELTIEIDVFQTWRWDIELKPCFVEREHVDDDVPGNYLLSEPACDLLYVEGVQTRYVNDPDYLVMQVSAKPRAWIKPVSSPLGFKGGTEPVPSSMLDRQWSAAEFWVFDLRETGVADAADAVFKQFSDAGGADAVLDAFTISDDYIDSDYLDPLTGVFDPTWPGVVIDTGTGEVYFPGTWRLAPGRTLADMGRVQRIGRPMSFKDKPSDTGYIPVNNKLYTFPYCFAVLSDGMGRETDYRFEYSHDHTYIEFELRLPVSGDFGGCAYPRGYDGNVTQMVDHVFTWSMVNKVPWYYSAFSNYMAQHAVSNTLSVVASAAMMAAGIYPGVAGMSRAANVLAKAERVARNTAAGNVFGRNQTLNQMMAGRILEQGRFKATQYALGETERTLGGIGSFGFAAVAEEIATNAAVPDVAKGNVAGNSLSQAGVQGLFMMTRTVREEVARSVDGFFSMYGYRVERLKVPNVTGRQAWNYVKCANPVMGGPLPSPYLDVVNRVFERGVTFWHTTDIGNYSLPNSVLP